MAFLALLVHYLLNPVEKSHPWDNYQHYLGWRELLLTSLPLSFVICARPFPNAISLLVPVAFLTSFPSLPLPGSVSFSILLWAFVLLVLRLHLPSTPSPVFLLSHRRTLPLAVFLSHSFVQIIFPSLLFFLPAFLVTSFLLSFSLADILLKILTFSSPSIDISSTHPAPMETRTAILSLFGIILLLLIVSVFMHAATLLLPSQEYSDPWDRYSRRVGYKARVALLDAFASYPGLYTFPPPFNVVRLLVWVPRQLFGSGTSYGKTAEKVVWRCAVGPFMIVVAILCSSLEHITRQ